MDAPQMSDRFFPETIRVSIGSAVVLRLVRGKLDAKPTTAYLLLCRNGKCLANCGFCPQAKESTGRADRLSRVTWPAFPTDKLIDGIETAEMDGKIMRVCIQTLNYPEVFEDLLFLVREIRSKSSVPISVSSKPLTSNKMEILLAAGANRISIALDAATHRIFDRTKGPKIGGPYRWTKQLKTLQEAVRVFGEGSVSTHLIVGLGETEQEMCRTIQWCVVSGIYPAMFAFTPISGTALEKEPPPSLNQYRRIQIAHYFLTHKKTCFKDMKFSKCGRIIEFGVSERQFFEAIESGEPFLTSGCPGCNRPYYNERPGGPIYNYPRKLLPNEILEAKKTVSV